MKRIFADELKKMGVADYETREVVIESETAEGKKSFELYSDCDDKEALEKLLSVCPELDGDVLRKALKKLHDDAWAFDVNFGGYWMSAEYCDDMDDACFLRVDVA